MVEIKHIQQKNDGFNWKCGAVCLEMIFNYYKIPCNQDAIWDAVKCNCYTGIGQKYALTHSLAEYAISQGLNATVYKSDSEKWATILEMLDQRSIPAILSVKENKSQQSHFVIFLGTKNGKYIFSDPNSSKETVGYDYLQVRKMWSPNVEINVTGFIYILFEGNNRFEYCPYCKKEYPLLTKDGVPFSTNIICPYCDRQISIT